MIIFEGIPLELSELINDFLQGQAVAELRLMAEPQPPNVVLPFLNLTNYQLMLHFYDDWNYLLIISKREGTDEKPRQSDHFTYSPLNWVDHCTLNHAIPEDNVFLNCLRELIQANNLNTVKFRQPIPQDGGKACLVASYKSKNMGLFLRYLLDLKRKKKEKFLTIKIKSVPEMLRRFVPVIDLNRILEMQLDLAEQLASLLRVSNNPERQIGVIKVKQEKEEEFFDLPNDGKQEQ
jgi:hypothetical protein